MNDNFDGNHCAMSDTEAAINKLKWYQSWLKEMTSNREAMMGRILAICGVFSKNQQSLLLVWYNSTIRQCISMERRQKVVDIGYPKIVKKY